MTISEVAVSGDFGPENFAISEAESDDFEQVSAKSRVSPRQRARGPDFLADFLIGKIANHSLVF